MAELVWLLSVADVEAEPRVRSDPDEVARLVQGNLPVALEHATQAAADADALAVEQRLDLYRLLMELNRRTGDFDEARRYRDAFQALRAQRGG